MAGGQQAQGGRSCCGLGRVCPLSSSKGSVIGFSSKRKALGKKARMKIARKVIVLRRLVSKGIGMFGLKD